MHCNFCGKKKKNENDLQLIEIGFKIEFCGCTEETIFAANEAKRYSELLAAADLSLQRRPNDKRVARQAARYYREIEKYSKIANT